MFYMLTAIYGVCWVVDSLIFDIPIFVKSLCLGRTVSYSPLTVDVVKFFR